MSSTDAQLCEVFNSIQGEGFYVGERQTFIRFAGCNLSCQYCDSQTALVITKEFKLEKQPGTRHYEKHNNPVNVNQLVESVGLYEKAKLVSHSISLTGGEPLLQVDFLKNFIPVLKESIKLPIYLETNGVLPDHLSEVIDLVDIIAFDIKLPSATGLSPYWKEHKKALAIAYLQAVFVKMVFGCETKAKELDEAVSLVAEVDPNIPLVLQPVTPIGPIKHRPNPEQIMSFYTLAKRKIKDVRVIPQIHKLLGVL